VALAGCGSSGPGGQQFALAVPDQPIMLMAPTTLVVQLVVLGAHGRSVTITSANLPGFAMLTGETLTLSPGYKDAGDYAIALTATAGTDSDTGTLNLHITRSNTPPMWLPDPVVTSGSSAAPAFVDAVVCDMEGDDITLEVDVAPSGMLDGIADYQSVVSFAMTPPLSYELPNFCADFRIPFPGLAPGTYDCALRAHDSLGAYDPYGWVKLGPFTVSP
jgi:hypothetical protein